METPAGLEGTENGHDNRRDIGDILQQIMTITDQSLERSSSKVSYLDYLFENLGYSIELNGRVRQGYAKT